VRELDGLYQLMQEHEGQTPIGTRTYIPVDADHEIGRVLELLRSGEGKRPLRTFAEWAAGQERDDLVRAIAEVGSCSRRSDSCWPSSRPPEPTAARVQGDRSRALSPVPAALQQKRASPRGGEAAPFP
jgi:hypothetical protein